MFTVSVLCNDTLVKSIEQLVLIAWLCSAPWICITVLTVWFCLHWQWFTEWAPACSILSCHFHTVCSLRFQPSHCVLLNPSSQIDAAWRIATVSLPILQHVGSVGGTLGLHSGMIPGEKEAGGSHIVCHNLHHTWNRSGYVKEIGSIELI